MRLPRDLSGPDLVRVLKPLGYSITRQTGSHTRLTTQQNGEHHITIPNHSALRIGTLAAILFDVSHHFEMERDELVGYLFK
jgi:predicted RNA binding protein YcfA (HicA-like mRNA interferase family)